MKRVLERLLAPGLLHLRQGHRPRLRQRRRRDPDQHLRPRLQPRAGRLRREAHVRARASSTSCPSPATTARRLAGQRHRLLRARACPCNITQTGTMASTGIGAAGQQRLGPTGSSATSTRRPDHRPVVRRRRVRSVPRDTTATFGNVGPQHRRGPELVQHRHVAHQEHEVRHASTPSCGSRPSTSSTTRSSASPTASSATRPSAPSPLSADPSLRHLRHLGAADPALGQGEVLGQT